jgi:hypothetical protein
MFATGSVVAQENGESSSRDDRKPSEYVVFLPKFDLANHRMAVRSVNKGIIDHLVSLEPSDGDPSRRYGVSLKVGYEDGDWNFEATVTIEF